MRRMKLVGLMITAVMALSAFVVAPAMAAGTNNPVWNVAGSRLALGSSAKLTAVQNGNQVLKAPGVEIVCTALSASGELLGSGAEGPGTNTETLTYKSCTVTGHSSCVAKSPGASNGEIKTNLLNSKLAWAEKESAEKELANENGTVTVFTPASGTTFVEIELTPLGSCGFTPTDTTVKGSVVATNVQKTATEEKETNEISSTGAAKYFVNPGAKEEKAGLTAFGLEASYKGKDKITLTSKSVFGVRA
jgi:hypothetical protein